MLLKVASAKRIGLQLIEDDPETALVCPRSCHKNLCSRLANDQLVIAHLREPKLLLQILPAYFATTVNFRVQAGKLLRISIRISPQATF